MSEHGFSIGTLAARTGLTPTVLRTWERRFGFPEGTRSSAGHRRFGDVDVERVREVAEARSAGMSLQAAIDAVRRRHEDAPESVHAALVRDFPHLGVQRLGRRALVAASQALEDESLARADRPVVLGAFQEGHRYAASRHRWDELGRTASWAAVVADFDDDHPADPSASPARCQLAEGSPLRREWTVVTVSAGLAAVVSAWEVPRPPGAEPVYESVISSQRPVALAAARVLAAAAGSAGARPPSVVDRVLGEQAPTTGPGGADPDRMWARALARLDPGA
ncbi:DNA-binding transcriptional regulator, MerR family [Nocardioides exalbidus]|uniref:DNA-binding transcriptional regulator, MerR family n=1 Tax=Nocardioides exalbidus TaxID=402596 RepID=A0A1H4MYY7_9ACTN|nr:DICT sensory domain-containing protein [Nocardioides exalbidus]SEB88183.1 DNA-binding transcriptional regulator, MerR family [Nocardioides exalbidus]